jgi:hypothetical protein
VAAASATALLACGFGQASAAPLPKAGLDPTHGIVVRHVDAGDHHGGPGVTRSGQASNTRPAATVNSDLDLWLDLEAGIDLDLGLSVDVDAGVDAGVGADVGGSTH